MRSRVQEVAKRFEVRCATSCTLRLSSIYGLATALLAFMVESSTATLVWQDGVGHRSATVSVAATEAVGFTRMLPHDTGILFTNYVAQERHLTNQILLNGSGVAAGDFDNDGWCDLYFCALDGDNRLYRNLGNWRFEEVGARAGVSCPGMDATGAVFADLNGDGTLDLIVNSIGQGTRVFINNGQGAFSQGPLLNSNRAGMSLAIADIESDGDLDVYIANYRVVTLRDQPNTRFTIGRVDGEPRVKAVNGRPLTDPDLTNRFTFRIQMSDGRPSLATDENGEPDVLYRNDGEGRFTALAHNDIFLDERGKPAGLQGDWGLSVMFRDINGDHAPDLYVCNDFKSPDRIWINDGKGRFRAVSSLALRQTSLSSMGVDFADINRDGHDDFIVLDMLSPQHQRRFMQRIDIQPEASPVGVVSNRMQTSRNTLFLNRGDGTYAEIAQLAGLDATEWSWTPIFLDVDLDGFEDLLVSSGFERDGMNVDVLRRIEQAKKEGKLTVIEQLHLRKLFPRLATGTLAFRNDGNLSFTDMTQAWRLHEPAVSQGMALADIDNDGDMDVVVNNMNDGASLYRNDATAPRIAVRLSGLKPNEAGIGARIKVSGAGSQQQEIICGGRYLSSDQPRRSFAAPANSNLTIEVTWRNGKTTVIRDVAANRIYEIREDAATNAPPPTQRKAEPLFADVSYLLSHAHAQDEFNDFARQPLLPNRLSQLGPGITWFDRDGDGWEELLIPGGSGSLAVFRNDRGHLRRNREPVAVEPHHEATVLGVITATQPQLLVGNCCYESGPPSQRDNSYDGGPLALGDYNRDGLLDIFVGGRVVPRAYPKPASSRLFRGSTNGFQLDQTMSQLLANIGLVSGAVFSDLTGDASRELALACEWGPIRVFETTATGLQEITAKLGLDKYRGLWTSITTGDFNGDGKMDIVAGNFGRNSRYERFRSQPIRLYYGDIDGDGTVDVIESCFDPPSKSWAPLQPYHVITAALPSVLERFSTAESYARSSFDEIYGPVMENLSRLEANWLETTVFLNAGDRFEARPLPLEAQFAPAFGICAADFDNDGKEDLFLAQNFFATHPETSRYDAGRGLYLRGNGDGSFVSVAGHESGIAVYGQGRGAAVCDFNHDGRLDLVVAQNGAAAKLFRNAGAEDGLRVTLAGPAENPNAIGAVLRARTTNDVLGPAKELKAGSGYWSQDSTTQVVPPATARVDVRWPSGVKTSSDVPAGAKAITITADGRATSKM